MAFPRKNDAFQENHSSTIKVLLRRVSIQSKCSMTSCKIGIMSSILVVVLVTAVTIGKDILWLDVKLKVNERDVTASWPKGRIHSNFRTTDNKLLLERIKLICCSLWNHHYSQIFRWNFFLTQLNSCVASALVSTSRKKQQNRRPLCQKDELFKEFIIK